MLRLLATLLVAAFLQPQDPTPYPAPASKKGLQVQMVDDALALGIDHAGLNVDLSGFVDLDGGDDAVAFAHEGRTWHFRTAPLAGLDAQVEPLSRAGVVVTAILLAIRTGDAARDRLCVHGNCPAKPRNGIGAFATDHEDGRAWLEAVCAFLAQRYSGEAAQGRIWNWVVGNEVNSHAWWYCMGKATVDEVAAAYAAAVRCVHDGVRAHSLHGRVFVSLEHHWNVRYAAGDATECCAGRELLTAFAKCVREGGDFDWHVAFHPYPEDLLDCRFWEDETATSADDSPRVTFANLPVLVRFLATDELRCEGKPRRVILSEQGFHCREGADGERDQAVAYALAWELVQRESTIDAFVLHRHVDHAHEGGLNLGLWSRKEGTVCEPLRRRRMAEVFLACDTDAWPACADFALPVLGVETLSEWKPRR